MNLKRLIQTFSLVLFLSLFSAGQASQMDNPARQQLAGWLAAYNDTHWDAYLEFLQKNFVSPPGRGFQDPSFRDRTGGYDLKKIEEETPIKVMALLQERASDGFARVALEVEPAEPHRILKMEVQHVERPPEFSLQPFTEKELIVALRKRLQELVTADRFAGAVLVAKNGKPIFMQAYGLADRKHNIHNTLKTRFSIASMAKMFTAVSTMQLVQAGKLSLGDPLGKYLIGYPNKELAAKVTIGELLTNTGGTGDIWGPEFDQHRQELRTLQDYVNLYGNRALRFDPGSRWEYSNFGFILLGAVIEKVSGESYYNYVRDHVYNPAGMTSTDSELEDQPDADRSVGYTREGASDWHPNTSHLSYRGTAAGGGYSTVGDLLNFANALRENRLLDAHYTALLTTGKVVTPFGLDAYGFGVQTINRSRCFGHNGTSLGVNGDLEMCLDSSYAIVVLANMDPPAAERISEFIMNRLPVAKPK